MSVTDFPTADRQAEIFANYLLGQKPRQQSIKLFVDAGGADMAALNSADSKLLRFVFRRPFLLRYIDAYLALARPASLLRKRLYLLFAIMEASPYYVDYFLPQKRSVFYVLMLPAVGLRAVCRLLIGAIIVKVNGL